MVNLKLSSFLKENGSTFFGNSFLIFVSRFFPALANLVVIIYFSHKLSIEVNGEYQNFWAHYYIFYSLVCAGIHLWLVTYSRDVIIALFKKLRPGVLLLYAAAVLVLSTCFALMQYHSVGRMFVVPFLFLAITPVTTILESFLIISKRYNVLVITNILHGLVYFAIHWFYFKQGYSLQTLFTWILIVALVKTTIYVADTVVIFKKYGASTTSITESVPHNTASLLMHIGIYDVLQTLSNSIDKFIISLALSAGQFAIYYNGSFNVPFLPLLLNAASSAVLMQLAHTKKEDEQAQAVALMNKSGRVLSCIVFPVFFYIILFRYELFAVVFTHKYDLSVPIFLFTTLVLPLRAYSFSTVLQKMHKGAIINAGSLGELVLACALMYPMYRLMGLCGVALSFVLSTYVQATFYIYHSAKILKVSPLALIPLRNWLTKMLIFGILFFLAHDALGLLFGFRGILITGGAVMAVTVLVALWMEVRGDATN